MKHWVKDEYEVNTISLRKGNYTAGVVGISHNEGQFQMFEECDSVYSKTLTKQELKEALQEVMDWVDSFEETK